MSKQTEALKLAIEWIGGPYTCTVSAGKMVAILTEALADQPAQRQEPTRYQELREVLENLMSWQVKNVTKWHNGAYDQASMVLKRHDATPPAPAQTMTFEQWLAMQHGDPEELGFLQALRIAYIAGQDSITKGGA